MTNLPAVSRSVFLGLSILVIIGCSSNPSIEEVSRKSGSTDDLEIREIRTITKNNILVVQVSIFDDGQKDLGSYRFDWMNEQEVSLHLEAWKPLPSTQGEVIKLQGIAPSPEATKFRFDLSSVD